MKPIYMDYSATTPVDPQVFAAMQPYFADRFGNPSSIYSAGQIVRKAVEESRERVAAAINADPGEIIFTSGGTEADNHALIGYMSANKDRGNHIITSAIEHHAVLDTCQYLQRIGFEVTFLPVSQDGVVDPESLKKAIRPNTIMVSIMHANNEIGTIQDIKQLAAIAHEKGAVFHTDAVQTVGKIPVDVKELDVDMLSASAHKLYGPKGIGFLYVKRGLELPNYLHGGGQEGKMRPGTENTPGIIGFAKALEIAQPVIKERQEKLEELGRRLMMGILDQIPDTIPTGHKSRRIPGFISVCFKSVDGEALLLMLDKYGIMASAGSACSAGDHQVSHVLLALGLSQETARGSLRLTLGKDNSKEEVDLVIQRLVEIVSNLRQKTPAAKV
ncbi:MAG: cysteine desulfurase NifS [Syntrophomonadaceae bacterium]|jgi:cysteine desulfurase